ncbi:hypothetical protein AAFF_G00056590 [Aldrovandia affinis]|uniref:Poly [ADP-ribose] polymerase n=1 Tax=Aldrovandia affinis TaxID=143900 RepID=A0AAD7S0G3_9TELE|nr:hypothetical protein AAFF_G00056590 [Aldrovandia affinis]
MITAVSTFIRDKPKSPVTTVRIVIFQPKMMSDFEQVMKKFKVATPRHSSAAAATAVRKGPHPTSRNLSLSQTNLSPPVPSLTSAMAGVTFPVMVADVYGVSINTLAQVKRCLGDLVAEECTSQDVVAEHLHLLSEADVRAIVTASQRDQVSVRLLQGKLTVSGKRDDVLSAVLQIKDCLQSARDRESREREEGRIWKTVRWEVGTSDAWSALGRSVNYSLELAFHNKDRECVYQHRGDSFTVDLKKLEQTDSRGNTVRIKRTLLADSDTVFIAPPPTWSKMDGKDLDIILLQQKSNEFLKISKDFVQSCQAFVQQTGKNIKVVQIQRIQHQEQWRRYAVSKQAVEKKYPNNKIEQVLYHGTTKDICQKINKNGFNRSFCGRNATMYGSGTYFAKDAAYSCHDSYSNPDTNGVKYMYRAQVLTGKPCVGQEGMKEPSPLDPNDLLKGLHDCAVNNLHSPSIFVIFCDSGAYPDYLITFKTV